MGQGSGGSAASLMALSSEGRNAKGVAALSGTPLSPGAVRQDPAKYAKELANRTNCPEKPVESLVNCLRKMPAEKIVQVGHNIRVKIFFSCIQIKSQKLVSFLLLFRQI